MKNVQQVRTLLNTLFLLLALVGVVLYFALPTQHLVGFVLIAIALIVKIAEFFIRFMF